MLQKEIVKTDVGVIVGRFQVDDLHEGHHDLIRTVMKLHSKIIIFLGVSPTKSTRNNPLDFKSRELMVHKHYPDVTIFPIYDVPNDEIWSKKLDEKIREIWATESVSVYGSRDGFAPYYHGKFNVVELEAKKAVSGTEIRKRLSREVISSSGFRHGVIYACYNKYPTSYTCVDGAVIDFDNNRILLARKKHDKKGRYRFFGGFVDITKDVSLEQAVVREVMEESGSIGVGTPKYVSSAKINDWRYVKEQDGILSTLFVLPYVFGSPQASDDIDETKWFSLDELFTREILTDEHIVFLPQLKSHLNWVIK